MADLTQTEQQKIDLDQRWALTRPEHTFDPQKIRGQPGSDLGTFWPNQMAFFLPEGPKIEKFELFRGNFPNPYPNQRWLTQPKQQKFDPTWPGSKNFDSDPSLVCVKILDLNWPIFVLVMDLKKFPPKFQFFPIEIIKYFPRAGQKLTRSKPDWFLIYCGVRSMLGSGQS